jgi:hypothetical protein
VSFSIDPNPVPWTSAAIDGCSSDTPNHWIWKQILVNNGSTSVTFSQRLNFFDGSQVSTASESITLSPGERHERTTRWCSGLSGDHTFRTDWVTNTGTRLTGATAQLQHQ